MATAILYYSKHGTTAKVAQLIAQKLEDPVVELYDLKIDKNPPLEKFDFLIIGGSIHMGGVPKRLTSFFQLHIDELMGTTLALYLCCMYEEDKAQKQFEESFPENLRNHSMSNGLLGGEFLFEKMNFMDRMIVRKVVGIQNSQSNINHTEIEIFVERINTASIGIRE